MAFPPIKEEIRVLYLYDYNHFCVISPYFHHLVSAPENTGPSLSLNTALGISSPLPLPEVLSI